MPRQEPSQSPPTVEELIEALGGAPPAASVEAQVAAAQGPAGPSLEEMVAAVGAGPGEGAEQTPLSALTSSVEGGLDAALAGDRGSRITGSQVTDSAFATLEQLRRPASALFAGAKTLLDETRDVADFRSEDFNPLAVPGRMIGAIPEMRASAMDAFFRFGDDAPTFADVLDAGGTPDFPGRMWVEFAGEVILDPLWFTPAGAIRRGGKIVAQVAGRTGHGGVVALERMGLPGGAKAIQGMADGINKAFTGAINEAGKEALLVDAKANRAVENSRRVLAKQEDEFERVIIQIARETGDTVEDVATAIRGGIESRSASFIDDLPFDRAIAHQAGTASSKGPDLLNLGEMVDEIIATGPYDPLRAVPNLSQRARELVEPVIKAHADNFDEVLRRDIGAKVNTRMMESERIDYITHILTPEAKDVLLRQKKYADIGRAWSPNHTSQLMRELRGVSISEVNAISLEGRLAPLGFQRIPMFIDNPAAIEAMRLYRSSKAIASVRVFDELAERFGRKIPVGFSTKAKTAQGVARAATRREGILAAQRAARADGFVPLKVKGYKDLWLPEEVADVVSKHFRVAGDEDLLAKAWETVMKTQGVWKRWTLAVFPEYHSRNAVSNVWNNYLAGMGPLQSHYYGAAAAIQSIMKHSDYRPEVIARLIGEGAERSQALAQVLDTSAVGLAGRVAATGVKNVPTRVRQAVGAPVRGARAVARKLTGRPPQAPGLKGAAVGKDVALDSTLKLGKWNGTVREMIDLVVEHGASQGGVFGSELLSAASGGGKVQSNFFGRSVFKTGKQSLPIRLGFQVGRNVEGNARIAHFMWRLSEGMTPTAAAKSVRKYLFDYDAVDPITSAFRKGPFPFAAWTRFNLPLQLEHLVTDPAKNALINKARVAIERAAGTEKAPDDRFIAEYIRTNMAIRTQRSGQNEYRVLLLNNWIPLGTLAEMGVFEGLDQGIKAMGKKAGNGFISLLTPGLTLPAEQVAGRSLFTGRPFLPDRKEFLNMRLSDRLTSILRTVRVLSVMDRFIGLPRGTTYGQQIIRTLTGLGTTTVNTKRGRAQHVGATAARVQELVGALRRERRRDPPSPEEIARLKAEIRKVQRASKQRRYNR